MLAAYNRALEEVSKAPETAQLHAVLLGGVDAATVQFARSALDRTTDIAKQAIESNDNRSEGAVLEMCRKAQGPLIDNPKMHVAVIGAKEAEEAGLSVVPLGMGNEQWTAIQQLWTRYFALGPIDLLQTYEGGYASQVHSYG